MIPKEIRRQAGLRAGMVLDVRWQEGRIEIEPASLPVELVRKGRLLVAVPKAEVAPLSTEDVEATRAELLHERAP